MLKTGHNFRLVQVFADGFINMSEKLKLDIGRVENIEGKEENAGYQASYTGLLKALIVWERVNPSHHSVC